MSKPLRWDTPRRKPRSDRGESRPLTVRRLIATLLNMPPDSVIVGRNDQGFLVNVTRIMLVDASEACDEYQTQYVTGARGHRLVEISE